MKNYHDIALLLLRIGAGALLIANHGWSKLISAFKFIVHGEPWRFIDGVANLGFPVPAFFAIAAALTESVGSVLIILGLFTRYAAAFVAITMSVAAFRHLTSDFRYELAAMHLLVALALILMGAGRYSLDAKRR
jgi:putative oxidoreductase